MALNLWFHFGMLPKSNHIGSGCVYVVVDFLSQVIFVFLLFLGMIMCAHEVETKEKINIT